MSAPPARPSFRSQVLHLGPHGGAHRVAVRAAVSLAVPLLLVWATDRMEWSIFVAFGAFVALYGRNEVTAHRLRLQAAMVPMFVGAVVAGTAVGLSDHRTWLTVPGAAVVAAIGSYASDAQRWHPPGPLFLVFAFGACSSIHSQVSDLVPALLVTTASAAFAVVVGGAGAGWRRLRGGPEPVERVQPRPSNWSSVVRRHVVRCALGCLVAGTLATALSGPLGIGHPYWAMVAAVVPLVARDWSQQVTRGAQRLLGTFGGLLLAAGLLALDLPVLALVGVVIVLQGSAELLIGRNYALALVVVTPLALLMVHLVSPTSVQELLLDRAVETLLGVAVGVGIGWLTRAPAVRAAST